MQKLWSTSMADFYDILGVSKSANANEIKRAYRKIAMKFHPDRNPENKEAEKKLKEAAEAYSVLSDDSTKRQYDQFGHSAYNNMGGQSGFNSMNMDDIFNQFGDIFGGNNPFESFFGGGRRASARPRAGADLKVKIKVSYKEIVNGGEKKIKIKHIDGPLGVRGRNSDNKLINEKLGWNYKMTLKEGLTETYKWIESQIEKN